MTEFVLTTQAVHSLLKEAAPKLLSEEGLKIYDTTKPGLRVVDGCGNEIESARIEFYYPERKEP